MTDISRVKSPAPPESILQVTGRGKYQVYGNISAQLPMDKISDLVTCNLKEN